MSGIVESGLQPFVSPELDRIRKFSHTRADQIVKTYRSCFDKVESLPEKLSKLFSSAGKAGYK